MNFDLSAINPANGDKYSPNLYKWLRKRIKSRDEDIRVYALKDELLGDRLFIGSFYDGEFHGTQLGEVLRRGTKAEICCYVGRLKFMEVPDFWQRYLAIGRCAIDTKHTGWFMGDESRFIENGDTRTCQWCGAAQYRKRWTETVERMRWELESEPTP
jgi:hypothetical protein